MADKNIMFKDADGYLKATIDNQTLPLKVKEINKQETVIILNKDNLDIAINDNIEFTGIINTPSESMRDLLRSGILYIEIQNALHDTLIKTTVPFENRNFSVCIPNELPMGDYYCKITYLESKYFLGCEYTHKFTVTKRPIGYKLDKSIYMGYPNQTISVQLYLYDYKTKKPIQTTILYKFNGEEYIGQTDKDGYIVMLLTIPEVVKEDCKSFVDCTQSLEEPIIEEEENYFTMDTRGWVYQNGQLIQWFDSAYHYYVGDLGIEAIKIDNEEGTDFNQERYHILEIEIQSESYEIYPISVRIHVQKSPTIIYWKNAIASDTKARMEGYVEGAVGRVKYGAIILTVKDEPFEYRFCVDDYGNFDYCFDAIDAMVRSSNNIEQYQKGAGNTNRIAPQIEFEVDRGNIINIINDDEYGRTYVYDVFEYRNEEGERYDEKDRYIFNDNYLRAKAKITTIKNNEVIPIVEGMICFNIYRQRDDGAWVRNYRYSEEITDDGEAEIVFNLSKEGKFYIYAEYYGMFEYSDVVSKKQYYKVVNDTYSVKFNKHNPNLERCTDVIDFEKMDVSSDYYIDDSKEGHGLDLDIDNWFEFDTYVEVIPKTIEIDSLKFDDTTLDSHADMKKIKLNIEDLDIEVINEEDNG